MNFQEWQRLGIEAGDLSEDEIDDYAGQNVLLNFSTSELGPKSVYKKRSVYPAQGVSMTEGTWICALESDKGMYRATPVKKVDASFFLELKRDQKDEIVSELWEKHRDELIPMLKEYYSETLAHDIQMAVNEAVSAKDSEIDSLKSENEALKNTVHANELIIEDLKKKSQSAVPAAEQMITFEGAVKSKIVVTRTSPDTIASPFFTAHKYFVHINRNLDTLMIQPHDYGTVVCINNALLLSGLGVISTYTEDAELPSEYVPDKGLIVHL